MSSLVVGLLLGASGLSTPSTSVVARAPQLPPHATHCRHTNIALCAAADSELPEPQQLELFSAEASPSSSPHKRRAVRGAASAALAVTGIFGGGALLERVGLGVAPAVAAQAAAVEAPAATPKLLNAAARKRLTLHFKSKLQKVPVFMVTNENGSPFLNRLASGDQSALMFLFPAEAERMLEGVLKAPNGASSGAKVFQTNLDRAFKLARLEPMQSGLRDQVTNRELTMVWQFMPHAAEQTRAQMVMVKSAKVGPPKVPAYIVDGLVLTKRGKEIRPVFLSKKDVDTALAKLGEEGKTAKVEVYDALGLLLSLAESIEAGEPAVEAEINSLEIVPPGESLDFRDQLKRDKPNRPPKIVPPDPRGAF